MNLNELHVESDFISVHVPLTSKTYRTTAQREVEIAKDGTCVVNAARGEIIDQVALCEVVKNGQITDAYCWNTGYSPSRRVIVRL